MRSFYIALNAFLFLTIQSLNLSSFLVYNDLLILLELNHLPMAYVLRAIRCCLLVKLAAKTLLLLSCSYLKSFCVYGSKYFCNIVYKFVLVKHFDVGIQRRSQQQQQKETCLGF